MQGKEKENTFNLNRIDFGARTFNPTIARWDGVDPLADERVSQTPYNFSSNNPVNSIDPDGALDEPCCGSDFLRKAVYYATNKAIEITTRAVVATAVSAKNQVQDYFKDVKASPFVSIEAKSTTGARLALGFEKGVEADINVLSVENASIKGELDFTGGSGSVNYLGKGGDVTQSTGGAGSYGAGVSYMKETTKNNGKIVSRNTEVASGVTFLGVGNASGSLETNKTPNSTTQTLRAYIGVGGVIGLSQVFDGELKAGIKFTRKTDE